MAEKLKSDCSCKRVKCEYHGNCKACRTHHIDSKYLPTCERLALKKKGITKKEDEKAKELE
ncbi:MAG: hypothetical protein PUC65_08090 [Clostridiales bacterium]|nr:hypothetical protein [Clostridiales bacterium]